MSSCVHSRYSFLLRGHQTISEASLHNKSRSAGKIALKQVTLHWAYTLPDLGTKDQKHGPVKAVAPVRKAAFPIGQISHNAKSG